ncbi:pentapeptide repeat-containing protein [Dulcicalothrix desertica]|uniref:pentapeptide repeat-containing protein n=1 Tax=Dulcicalothrix desertica TaxID=32056 RepID=UPI0023549783|nr:pentapeptide repeat-containing protein [Dulcicalothrix desertica]
MGHGNLSLTIIDDTTKIDEKWRKVWEIVQGRGNKYLNNIDLSNANLNYADLSNANLEGADLSNTFLFHTNLSYSILIGANLSNANLKYANVIGTDFSGANVSNAQFSKNPGISEPIKQELIRRGAIFEDSPGDRSSVLVSC